jgi:glycosyltransferase involved in cell wall biosynthesis
MHAEAEEAGVDPLIGRSAPSASGRGRIRVVFGINNLNLGGTELNAVRTAERLDRERFEIRFACLNPQGPLLARVHEAGLAVDAFPISKIYGADASRQGNRLRRFLRESGAEIFHAHDAYSTAFGVPWARLAGVRTIASRRWWAAFPNRWVRYANRISYTLADVVLANSEGLGGMLESDDRVPKRKIRVVRNFLNESAFNPLDVVERARLLAEIGVPGDATVVGNVANLSPVKDQQTLIRAFASVAGRQPSLHLVIFGEGACRAELEREASELGVGGRVHMPGRRSNEPNLHQLFDISIHSSVSEGLPNAILEAMAAGRPVVATAVGATGDAVEDGVTGLLAPPSNPEALGRAVESLLTDPNRAREMGARGRRRARERYSQAPVLESLGRVYEELATKRRAADRLAPPLPVGGKHPE